jgi:hypothetical protein
MRSLDLGFEKWTTLPGEADSIRKLNRAKREQVLDKVPVDA